MRRSKIAASVAALMALGLITSCGSTPSATSSGSTAASESAATDTPTAGGTLNLLIGTATEHWDPQRTYVGVAIEFGNRTFSRTLTTWSPVTSNT